MTSRSSTNGNAAPTSPAEDRQLVDRCLAGEPGAWDLLHTHFHDRLLTAIRQSFAPATADPNLVDEIAARVWYVVVADGGSTLSRFDASLGCRLSTFLGKVARTEASGLLRSEKRRKTREHFASKVDGQSTTMSPSEWSEFLDQLSPKERQFVESSLEKNDARVLSDANRWQLTRRIRVKLSAFLQN